MARPKKELDELTSQRIVRAIEQGGTRRCAAQAAGVAPSTLFKWLSYGRSGDPAFLEFTERVARAEATAETAMSSTLFEAGKSDARFALEWLGRRRPASWAKRDAPRKVDVPSVEGMSTEEIHDRLTKVALQMFDREPAIRDAILAHVDAHRAGAA